MFVYKPSSCGFESCSCHLNIYLFKVSNIDTRYEICSNLTIKAPERSQWRCPDVFVNNFEHVLHLALVFILLTLSRYFLAGLDNTSQYNHSVKAVRIRSCSGSHFPAFGLNLDPNNSEYGHFLRSELGEVSS